MNTQETLLQLEKLKLHGMSKAYQGILAMPVQEQPSLHQFMARMAQAELLERDRKRSEAGRCEAECLPSRPQDHVRRSTLQCNGPRFIHPCDELHEPVAKRSAFLPHYHLQLHKGAG